MDEFALGLGQAVIGIAVTAGVVACCLRSPAFRWTLTVGMLLVWLSMGTLAPAVWMFVQLNKGQLGAAALCLLTAGFMSACWVALGWPVLRRYWELRSVYATRWE